jgi:hypothetical protein
MIESFQPLTRGQYPVFNKYPKFIVDYQIQEKEKLRQEEMNYIRQRYKIKDKKLIIKFFLFLVNLMLKCIVNDNNVDIKKNHGFDNRFVKFHRNIIYLILCFCLAIIN